jgi:hypothetical protein
MTTGVGGFAAESKQERAERIALNAIKAKLPIKGDKESTWYVIQFDTITKSTSTSGSVTRTTVRSSVQMDKFQGQDAAAKAILEFLTSPTPGTKAFYRDAFPDSDWGRTQMEKHMERLRISGAMKGYSPPNR